MRAVRIKRKLPGTLVVLVTENPPVALVSTPRGLVVTDADGDSLPVDPTRIDVDLPVLARKDSVLLRLLAETQAEEPALFARVSEVRRAGRGEIVFELPEFRILADSAVNAARLAEVLPVELDVRAELTYPWHSHTPCPSVGWAGVDISVTQLQR